MESTEVVLARHEERLDTLERDILGVKEVQEEIRLMNESLLTLANELKHTNAHLCRHEQKLEAMENAPRARAQQILVGVLSAIAAAAATAVFTLLLA